MLQVNKYWRAVQLFLHVLLGLVGVYLGISWFLGYIWAGVWNSAILIQLLVLVIIGGFFWVGWLVAILTATNRALLIVTTIVGTVVSLLLLLSLTDTQPLPVKADWFDLIYVLVVTVYVARRIFRQSDSKET